MPLECPNCREPVSFLRAFRTTGWGRFQCKACGSILGISVKRRLLAIFPWLGIVVLLFGPLQIQQYGTLITLATFTVLFFPLFYLFEKIVLLDRRAFCCRKCGYDLQGQVENRCPECGLPFDPTEKARIQERIGAPPPKAKHRWVMVLLFVLLALTLLANLLTYRAAKARRPGGAQPAKVTHTTTQDAAGAPTVRPPP
jgi:hypothetical protein